MQKLLRSPASIFNTSDKVLKFGVPLQELCIGKRLPPRLKDLLDVVYAHGSESVHVFGVRPVVSDCEDLKLKLEQGENINWHAYSVYVHAAVLLNFLESLPSPLLGHKHYDDWMDVVACKNTLETKAKLMRVSKSLPEIHQELLRQFLMVLRKLCRDVPRSHVTPVLAGHFVGPSLLWKRGSQFAVYPDSREHASLAALVRCLILFLDDVWNDIDEQATFSPRKRSTRKDAAATLAAEVTDAFVHCNASQFVDSLEREARQRDEIRDLIAGTPSDPQMTSSVSNGGAVCQGPGRSVHTWPGYGKRREAGSSDGGASARPAAPHTPAAASERASKVATFPRCSNSYALAAFADDKDNGPAFPSQGGEDYLYPDWAFQYPEWNLLGTELPGWAARSCFTLDMNSLAEQTTRKWISINTRLHNRTLNVTTSGTPPAHNTLSGTRL